MRLHLDKNLVKGEGDVNCVGLSNAISLMVFFISDGGTKMRIDSSVALNDSR